MTALLGAEGSPRVHSLDQEGLDGGHFTCRRALVLEHRRDLVKPFAEGLLLHEGLSESHVHAALHLPDDEGRVDGPTDVVGDPHPVHFHAARLLLDAHLCHAGGVAICGGRADARALVGASQFRRRVRTGSREGSMGLLRDAARLLPRDADLRIGGVKDAATLKEQTLPRHPQLPADGLRHEIP